MKAAFFKVKRKPTLNDKLRSLGLVFVLIVGCACTLIFSYVELMNQKKNIHRQLEQTISLQQQFIDKWLDDRMSDVALISNYPMVKIGSSASTQQLIELVKSSHKEFRTLTLVDSGGMTADGLNIRDRDYFIDAKQGHAAVSDMLFSLKDGKRIIVFAAPIMGEDKSFKGIVMGTVELTTIEQLMHRFSYGEKGQTYLVDWDGTLITGKGSGTDRPVRIDADLLKQAKAGIQSSHAYDNYGGVAVYGDYVWTKNGSWLIIGEAARKDVLASLYTELKYASLFILLAMLAAVLVMLRTSKKIAGPVNLLLRGVRMIKDGGYHYRIDPSVLEASTIEFQQLGLTFNSMSDTILEHTEALSKERNFASSIIDTASALIVVLDKDCKILRFNSSCEITTGYTFEEVRNRSIYDRLIPDEERGNVAAHFYELLTARGGNRNENHWRTRSGELRLIAWSNTILLEPNGDIKHIIGIGIDITEQRKVEQALRESEERFRLIVGSMDEIVATFDSELRLTGVYGRSVEENVRWANASYEGKTIHQMLDNANARLHEDAQRTALQEKTTVLDWSLQANAGQVHHYQTSYSTLRDNDGERRGVVSVSRDITQLKQAEEAYRESQERVNNILESITDAFMALNNDWTFTYVNSEAERMLGKSRSEIMGKLLSDVFPRMVDSPIYANYRKALEEQVPISTEDYVPFLKAWYEVHIYPSKDGLSIYFQDVTLRKELEQTALESQLRLGTIIETVPSGIIVIEEDGMISMANRMAEDIFGMDKEEIVNRVYLDSVWVLYDFDGNPIAAENFPVTIAMRTGRPVSNFEFIFEKPSGEQVKISCNCSPVFDQERRIRSILVSLSDITGRIAIQSELQAANDELRKLSSLDGLTGVFNRRYFNEQLQAEWSKHALKKEPLSLIMLDIDYFKAYNDTYGHLGGDMCLKTVASMMQASLNQPSWFIARYGGEEFGIMLPGITQHEAAALAESLRDQVEKQEIPHANSRVSRFLTISLGVASTVPLLGGEAESLVSAADKCLYEAKRTRNRVVVQREAQEALTRPDQADSR